MDSLFEPKMVLALVVAVALIVVTGLVPVL
jgi:hypothetical protein